MNPEAKYIQNLEYKIWRLESSKSYRLTYPLRKGEEIINTLRRLPRALRRFFQPKFQEEFNARAYMASSNRPSGWWRKFPAFHFCLFSSLEEEDDGIYDALDPAKPTVVSVTHAVCRTGAPILVLDLVNRFAVTHNVVVFSIGGGALKNTFKEKSTVFVGPIPRSTLGFVLDQELKNLKKISLPEFAIVNSIESTEALEELWRHDVPVVHLVHEFAVYTRPLKRMEISANRSSEMVFSAEIVRDNAISAYPGIAQIKKIILPQGTCALPENSSTDEEKEMEEASIRNDFRPKGWPRDTIVVLGAGTVQLRKGLDLFISCAKKVVEMNPQFPIRFVWIGSGYNPENDLNYSCFIQKQLNTSDIGDSFVLLNEVEQLQCAYDSADIFFLSSKLDPLPLVAQDALLNKLPLICFEGASGIPEYINEDLDASTGVVPYLDVDAAAQKILTLAADEELRRKVGDAGQRLATKIFNQERYFETLLSIGKNVAVEKSQEIKDRELIFKSGILDVAFSYPRLAKKNDDEIALKYYTTAWHRGMNKRKPFPGFHPGIYLDHHNKIARDPLAHYLEEGRPAGPWLSEVIHPEKFQSMKGLPANLKAALHIHLHYTDVASEIFDRLRRSKFHPDLYLSVTSEEGKLRVQEQLDKYGQKVTLLKVVPNRGRDIGPFFTGFPEIFNSNYEFIGHIHGKKSVQLDSDFASQWSTFLYENLLGGKAPMLQLILEKMQQDASTGLVFADDPHVVEWDGNWSQAEHLAKQMGIENFVCKGSINFPVGTMFWARRQALQPLVDLNLKWEDYPPEPLPHDGSILHAIERLLPSIVAAKGFRSVLSNVPGVSR